MTHEQIMQARRENERTYLLLVHRANRRGALWNFPVGAALDRNHRAPRNAVDRLRDRGQIVWVPARAGRAGGYRAASVRAPRDGWSVVDAHGRV